MPCAEATSTARIGLGSENPVHRLYLESKSATADPFLSTNEAAGSSEAFTALGSDSFPSHQAQALTQRPSPTVFKADGPAPGDLYFNLSRPIVGVIHYRTQVSDTSGGRESITIIAELWAGDKYLGGDMHFKYATTAGSAWTPIYLKFRPEARMIEAGAPLALKVYRWGGAAGLVLGTGGQYQSVVEISYFHQDPLAGAFFVEGKKLYPIQPEPSGSGLQFATAGLLLAAAPLIAPGGRRRAGLALVLLLSAGLAGCLGGEAAPPVQPASGRPGSTAEQNKTLDGGLAQKGHGALQGYVRNGDKAGIPVKGAHIAVLGTNHFGNTNAAGFYQFPNITAGVFRLRIDAAPFLPYEGDIRIEVGYRLWLNVTLFTQAAKNNTGGIHHHDEWQGATTKTYEVDFEPASYLVEVEGVPGYVCYFGCAETAVPNPVGMVILPGTTLVEVVAEWGGTAPPPELSMRILTSANSSFDQHFTMRPAKTPYRIPIFPHEADAGHLKQTDWSFFFRAPYVSNTYQPFGPLAWQGTSIHLKITIHKGIVPLEPEHPDLWQGRTEIKLFDKQAFGTDSVCCVPPYYPSRTTLTPKAGILVPPGSKEIKGTLTWTVQGSPTPDTWHLVYRSPNKPNEWVRASGVAKTGAVDFTIALTADMPDQFYQKVSKWKFGLDNDTPGAARRFIYVNEGTQRQFLLTATVYRDPAYVAPP